MYTTSARIFKRNNRYSTDSVHAHRCFQKEWATLFFTFSLGAPSTCSLCLGACSLSLLGHSVKWRDVCGLSKWLWINTPWQQLGVQCFLKAVTASSYATSAVPFAIITARLLCNMDCLVVVVVVVVLFYFVHRRGSTHGQRHFFFRSF